MTLSKLSEYGHVFQVKVIALLLSEKKFLDDIFEVLSSDYFESSAHKWTIDCISNYYKKYHTYPTDTVIVTECRKVDNDVLQVAILESLDEIASEETAQDMDYIQEEFLSFCRNQGLKNALMKSATLLNDNNFDEIWKLIGDAMVAGHKSEMGHDYAKDIETRYREESKKKFPFPWPIFNRITDGGLSGGDLMLVFAPPGIGKSTTVSHMAAYGVKMGKNVMFYSLELADIYVGQKIDSILTGIDVKDIKDHRKEIDEEISKLAGRLIIKRYPPGKASIRTLEAHIRQLKNQEGFVPDIVIIDYPDYLKVEKSRKDVKQEIDDIFVGIKGLAVEMDIPVACPSQINRAGANDDIIEGAKVAGSFDKMMIGDFNVSLSRRRRDKTNGTGRFHIMKSRLGPDGMTYLARINMSCGLMEISDIEYVEDGDDAAVIQANGRGFDRDEVQELRAVFNRFTRNQ